MSAIWMVSRAPRRADGLEFRRDETALRHRAELFLPGDASCQVNTSKSKTNSAEGRFRLPKDEITEAEKQRAFRGETQVRRFCRARVFSACPVPGMCPCRGIAGAAADVRPESAGSAAHSQPLSRSSETATVCRGLCRVLTRPVSPMPSHVPLCPPCPPHVSARSPGTLSTTHSPQSLHWGGGRGSRTRPARALLAFKPGPGAGRAAAWSSVLTCHRHLGAHLASNKSHPGQQPRDVGPDFLSTADNNRQLISCPELGSPAKLKESGLEANNIVISPNLSL